ncbi:MAG: hypothetical protein WCZ89_05760, partial [Phycisphaerae bacterium]
MDILLNIAAAAAIMLAVLSMFSNLGWIMKFRIIAVALAGIIITGLLAWHIAGQLDVKNIVIFPTLAKAVVLLVLAFITGFAAYFAAWPYGRQIAPVAVPLGLAVWALRSADIASLMQKTADAAAKYQVINQFKWTAMLWLMPIAAGFGGILLAELLLKGKPQIFPENNKKVSQLSGFTNIFTAIAASVLIALFCIKMFAQDVKFSDLKLGSVVAQPHPGQIAFAVAVSFG